MFIILSFSYFIPLFFNVTKLLIKFIRENNKRKIVNTNSIMYTISLISPIALFLTYYFNACVAHNLYMTFYTYKNNYLKRLKKYYLGAISGILVVLFFSLIFNHNEHRTTIRFSLTYYNYHFIRVIYFFGLLAIIYIVSTIVYILNRRNDFFQSLKDETYETHKKTLIILFVKRHITFLCIFLVCYMPNNIILLIQTFSDYKICNNCESFCFLYYIMSISCSITFTLKMTEPYMQKYIKIVAYFVLRKKPLEIEVKFS